MKKSKKGFTIVELVIVIAVIAILAGVLIPTFSGVVKKANESKALQIARNALTGYVEESTTASLAKDSYINYGEYWFSYDGHELKPLTTGKPADFDSKIKTATPDPKADWYQKVEYDKDDYPDIPAGAIVYVFHDEV